MSDQEDPETTQSDVVIRQARVTTTTAEEMDDLLRRGSFELVGRGPRRSSDGGYVAEIIGVEDELLAIATPDYRIEIRRPPEITEAAEMVSRTNRYADPDAVPTGLGKKE
jgi:hypothetical protein